MPEYGIGRLVLASNTFLPISQGEFEQVLTAKSALLEALATEEAFDLLLANFVEFEREMLDLALGNMVYADRGWQASMDQIQGLNRRLLNLLSAGRLYLDHLPQHVAGILGKDSPGWQAIDTVRREQYATLLGYRVMEGLRNYIQHRSLPIRAVTHNMRPIEVENEGYQVRNVLTPLLELDHLEEGGALKKSVLEELRPLGRQVDIKPLVREYVQGLGAIHQRLRAEVVEAVEHAATVFNAVAERWKAGDEPGDIGLAVIERKEDGTHSRSAQVFSDPITRHASLIRKNRRLGRVREHYISSEVDREAAKSPAARG